MAAPSSLYRSSITMDSISRSFTSLGKGLNGARKTVANITKTIGRENDNKKRAMSNDSLLFQRKRENIRRKKQRSILELSGVGAAFRSPSRVIQNTGRSIFGRILSVAGTIMAGWLIYNLPTIVGMAQELIARIKRLTVILSSFLPSTGRILNEFKDLFGAYATNFVTFDFFDSSGRVSKAMGELSQSFLDLNSSFEEALTLITTPLTEPLEGPGAPPFGTEYPQEPSGTTGTPGTGGRLQPIHKQALDIISGPESGGNYNAMNNGQAGDRPGGSKKWLGKNLTDMTIGEIKYHQNVKKDLWASGRYQIVPSSLPIAQKSAGLRDTDKFDENNQDLLGIGLLKVQGPGAWTNYSKYSSKEIEIMYKAKNTPLGPAPAPVPPPKTTPSPSTPPQPTGKLIPQTGPGGFIQGGSGAYGDTTYATHFHIDLKNANYTEEGRAKIRDVAFQAIKVMQARGSTVYLTNFSQLTPASKNDSILRSQILQDQQLHEARSTPGIDIQEINPSIQRTFPSQPGSKTKFPFAVGSVYMRGGYGREAEIIGSGGVTVSHGAPGSMESQVPQQTSATRLSFNQISSVPKPTATSIASAPERKGPTVIVTPQVEQPQAVASAPSSGSYSGTMAQMPVNNVMLNRLLTELAYT